MSLDAVLPQVFVFEPTDPPEEYRVHLAAHPTFVYNDEHPHKAWPGLNRLHHSCCDAVQRGLAEGANPVRVQKIVCTDLAKLRTWVEAQRGAQGTYYTDCGACRPADPSHAAEKPARGFELKMG